MKKIKKYFFINFFSVYKYVKRILSKKKNKEKVLKKSCDRYENLSEEEKDKTRQYVHEQYKNLPEKEKEKKLQYGRE